MENVVSMSKGMIGLSEEEMMEVDGGWNWKEFGK